VAGTAGRLTPAALPSGASAVDPTTEYDEFDRAAVPLTEACPRLVVPAVVPVVGGQGQPGQFIVGAGADRGEQLG
jgi:hypothetical protein